MEVAVGGDYDSRSDNKTTDFFLNPLLFASCTNTFSKCCEITTTTDIKRSAQ
jgi:hypothetical protein